MSKELVKESILEIIKSQGYKTFEDFERVCKDNMNKRKNQRKRALKKKATKKNAKTFTNNLKKDSK